MNLNAGRLLMVIGLPGAGKSTLINDDLKKRVSGPCIHDFHGNAIDNSQEVKKSRYYAEVVKALKAGHDCVIADIEFCRPERRDIVVTTLQEEIPDLAVEYHCFKNQPDRCEQNVIIRNSDHVCEECSKIRKLSMDYIIPNEAIEYDVHQCEVAE